MTDKTYVSTEVIGKNILEAFLNFNPSIDAIQRFTSDIILYREASIFEYSKMQERKSASLVPNYCGDPYLKEIMNSIPGTLTSKDLEE